MATDDEYRREVRKRKSHAAVARLVGQSARADSIWAPGKAFEYGIVRAFELEVGPDSVVYPFPIVAPPGGADRGVGTIEQVDGIVYAHSLAALLESKDHEQNVDIEAIAQLRMRLERRPSGTFGVIFTRKGLTEPALYLLRSTQPKNILVWQGSEIELAIREKRLSAGLLAKYRHAVEFGLPDYNLQREPWA